MKAVKKVLTLLLILTIISQIFIPSNVKAQNTIRTYDSNSLYDEVAKNAVLDNKRSEYVDSDTGIDFTEGASEWNGQGVYTIASTKDDLYPIHYYRGNIDNNNVLFGGFCWQIVRTTETGGVKLIYNGKPVEGKCENPDRDSDLKTSSMQSGLYMYGNDIINIKYDTQYFNSSWYELVDILSEDIYYDWQTTINFLNEDFYYSEEIEYSEETRKYTLKNVKHHNSGDSIDEIKNKTPLYYCDDDLGSCNEVKIFLKSTTYNIYWLELSNGLTYEDVEQLKKKNLIFANDVEYKDGYYELKNIINIPLMSINTEENIKKVLDGHHYFCDDFTNNCEKINYIYDYQYSDYMDAYDIDYAEFTNGNKADDVYNEFKSSTNENDSEMKQIIDEWYNKNLIDDTKYLEDTIWCNDRSIIANIFNKEFDLTNLYNINNFKLSHTCSNINDMFTVSSKNGNGKLTYPVATITDREVAYAGSSSFYANESKIEALIMKVYSFLSYYGNGYYDEDFLTMTPFDIGLGFYAVDDSGNLREPTRSCGRGRMACEPTSFVRPMVSLKHSMVVSSGDGTPSNPYKVIEGDTAEVQYIVDGDMPNGFLPPEVESYLKGSKVKMNGLKAGDIINGYRFLGWQTKDVEVVDGAFDMPENKVVFVGKFEKIEDSPLTYDSIGKYLTTGIIGVVGLAGFIIIKKKMLN